MKLDPTVMRTMNAQDFRVLEAVEKGMKNHALVPVPLITSIANLRHGGTHKILSSLLRDKLLSHERQRNSYDGYRLTNAGYDILALHNLKSRGFVAALGQRIGTGKESDIYLAVSPSGQQVVLKFHRLGRTSFRNVRKQRDYFSNKSSATQQAHSWLFLSRLSALKEYAFMKALFDVQYPTPTPVAHNRHVVVMSLVRGLPLYQIYPKQLSVEQAADIYEQSIALAARLAQHGLVHCDLNEFNLLVDLSGVQALATAFDDPYVRHSGQSVAPDQSVGALTKPAWEQSLEQDDRIAEAMPEPTARLENGQPKPIVTLIDFPQMISTKHPNAEELYMRDLKCLRRFFELKLQCTIPDEVGTDTTWERLVQSGDDETDLDRRLDDELKASGYSDDLKLGLELYYFEETSSPRNMDVAVEEDVDSDNGDDGANSNVETRPVGSIDTTEPQAPEELRTTPDGDNLDANGDNDSLDDDGQEDVLDLLDHEQMQSITRDQIEEQVKNRVRRQIEEQRRRSRKHGAFKKGNSNKTYVKGKRVLTDAGF